MKRALSILALSTIILAACNGNGATQKTKQKPAPEEEHAQDMPSQEVNVEVVEQKSYAFVDESSDSPTLSTFAVIKNTSEIPVDISMTSVDYFDKEGGVLGKSEQGTQPSPYILEPGEIGYVEVWEPADVRDTFGEAKVNVSAYSAAFDIAVLPTEKIDIKIDDSGSWTDLKITGVVKNETKTEAKGADIAAALYDKDGKFLAVMEGSVEDVIAPGQSVAFELHNPEFPGDVMKQVAKAKVIASYADGM